jgi:pyruvate dehydrogenase E2 component (dihydrolipoamide acetyltransferase)
MPPTPVVMPQMGESIAEGTIVRWIKKVGDAVDRDEPLFEISTDKVDAEIPSPIAGVLTEIKVAEGETVAVNSVVGTIGQSGEQPVPPAGPAASRVEQAAAAGAEPSAGKTRAAASTQQQPDGSPVPVDQDPVDQGQRAAASSESTHVNGAGERPHPNGHEALTRDELRRQKSSPLVRRIAKDNNVDIGDIAGSGIGGRVTKHDILDYIEHRPSESAQPSRSAESATAARPAHAPAYREGERVELQPLSVMRRKIAEHMVLSRRTSAHVHSVFHVSFAAIDRIRHQKRADYERLGARLTYTTFIAKAVIDALHRHPIVNASLDGDNVVYKKDVNLGIAVALESGLIVPVIRNADEKNLLGLSRAIADVAERARTKQLKPEEVQSGTFTITNPGQFGAQFGMPIINQPQVAILGIGTIEKRPVVIDDAIAIRTMGYLTLGYDHRLVDGAIADQFMADVKHQLEHFDPNQV